MEFDGVSIYKQKEYQRLAVYAVAFSLREKRLTKKNFSHLSQSKDEIDGIQITNILTSVTENVTSAEFACAEEDM